MSRVIVNCEQPDWLAQLHSHLSNQTEVDLINFEFTTHGKQCEDLARMHAMEMTMDRDPKARALHFRKKSTEDDSRCA